MSAKSLKRGRDEDQEEELEEFQSEESKNFISLNVLHMDPIGCRGISSSDVYCGPCSANGKRIPVGLSKDEGLGFDVTLLVGWSGRSKFDAKKFQLLLDLRSATEFKEVERTFNGLKKLDDRLAFEVVKQRAKMCPTMAKWTPGQIASTFYNAMSANQVKEKGEFPPSLSTSVEDLKIPVSDLNGSAVPATIDAFEAEFAKGVWVKARLHLTCVYSNGKTARPLLVVTRLKSVPLPLPDQNKDLSDIFGAISMPDQSLPIGHENAF